jgi:hypothetical protein
MCCIIFSILLPNFFCVSVCNPSFAHSIGDINKISGIVANAPAIPFFVGVSSSELDPQRLWQAIGKKKNLLTLITELFEISAVPPCEKNPLDPCVFANAVRENTSPPADAMRRARTTSTGYIMTAVEIAAAVMGARRAIALVVLEKGGETFLEFLSILSSFGILIYVGRDPRIFCTIDVHRVPDVGGRDSSAEAPSGPALARCPLREKTYYKIVPVL